MCSAGSSTASSAFMAEPKVCAVVSIATSNKSFLVILTLALSSIVAIWCDSLLTTSSRLPFECGGVDLPSLAV